MVLSQAGPLLSVDEAVRLSLARSPRMKSAAYAAQAAQAQTDREKPVAAPSVTATAEGRLQGPRLTFPRAGSGDDTVIPERYGRIELNLEQPLFHAGAGPARERYAAQTRANALELKRQENDLALDVRRAYYQLVSAINMRDVARGGVDLAKKHLDLTKLMLTAGNASERDEKASDADLAEAEQGLVKADNGVALARANLNRVIGRDPSTSVEPSDTAVPVAVPTAPDEGIAQALRLRPELRALEEGITAAKAGTSLARLQNSPALSGRATAAAQTPTGFANSHYYAAGLVMTWNPFDTARSSSDVKEARARVGQLEAQLEDARLGIRVEVEKAWRDMREASARIETSTRQATSAEKALEISEVRFEARAATQLEVSSALFNVAKARSNRAQAQYDLLTAAADYRHAVGADLQRK